jgi:tetratricopeptide (TPR) repeat protein
MMTEAPAHPASPQISRSGILPLPPAVWIVVSRSPSPKSLGAHLAAFLIICTFFSRALASGSPFDEANQLYDQGKFAEAKQQYEKLAASGGASANLYFNLGDVEYRLGDRGRAILDYERALALDPRLPEARSNLQLAREQAGARVPAESPLERAILPWPADNYAILAAVAGWLAVFSAAAMWLRRRGEHLGLWASLLLSLAIAAYSGLALWQDSQQRDLGIITAKETVARLEPADRAAAAETLPAGSRVRVVSEHGDWNYCELPGGIRGWLSAGSMERVRAPNS